MTHVAPVEFDAVTTGDINDYQDATLNGVADLTSYSSISATIVSGTTSALLNVTVTDAAERIIRIDWGDANGWLKTAAVGKWVGQIDVVFTDGSQLSWPKGSHFSVEVVGNN